MNHGTLWVCQKVGGGYYYATSRASLQAWVRGGKKFAIKYTPIRKATCVY